MSLKKRKEEERKNRERSARADRIKARFRKLEIEKINRWKIREEEKNKIITDRNHRLQIVFDLRLQNHTYEEIGNVLEVSRERVRQMIQTMPENMKIQCLRMKKDRPVQVCIQCKKEFISHNNTKSCSRVCSGIARRKYPEFYKKGLNYKQIHDLVFMKKYHSDPEFHKRQNQYQWQYRKNRMERDPVYKKKMVAMQKKASAKWLKKKLKVDPEYLKKK